MEGVASPRNHGSEVSAGTLYRISRAHCVHSARITGSLDRVPSSLPWPSFPRFPSDGLPRRRLRRPSFVAVGLVSRVALDDCGVLWMNRRSVTAPKNQPIIYDSLPLHAGNLQNTQIVFHSCSVATVTASEVDVVFVSFRLHMYLVDTAASGYTDGFCIYNSSGGCGWVWFLRMTKGVDGFLICRGTAVDTLGEGRVFKTFIFFASWCDGVDLLSHSAGVGMALFDSALLWKEQ